MPLPDGCLCMYVSVCVRAPVVSCAAAGVLAATSCSRVGWSEVQVLSESQVPSATLQTIP